MNEQHNQHGTALVVVETPLQLFNATVFIAANRSSLGIESATLVIYETDRFPDRMLTQARESKQYSNIIYINKYRDNTEQFGAARATILRALSFRKSVERIKEKLSLPSNRYDILIGGSANLVLMDFKLAYVPNGPTYFVEEGEGTYIGNFIKSAATYEGEMLTAPRTRSRRALSYALFLLSGKRLKFDTKGIYVYEPELVEKGVYSDSIEINSLLNGSKLIDLPAAQAFAEKNQKFDDQETRCVYLGLPYGDIDHSEIATIEATSKIVVGSFGRDAIYRVHPRGREDIPEAFAFGGTVDTGESSWEGLFLSRQLSQKTVLIGFGSSAQSNPKRMFGLEPNNVFLHRLIPDGALKSNAEKSYQMMKKRYKNQTKLHAPTCFDELNSIIETIRVER